MEIGLPSSVRHISHVTFDRLNGFLGLPLEFELEVPRRVPSASTNAFGVSAESMQCSYDARGNSVPTILLLLQERLYGQGGLRIEGIFRINPENSQEDDLRDQLNKGIIPYDIDVHCLAGLIKAWFRELPNGVMDSLTPEQVMQCHTEDHCVALIKMLPLTQAALMDWAINLMTDVVQEESFNKMNARNIAVVFAPNMTHMSDPLTALMHAVQVMNLLKTLILKTLKDREAPCVATQLITWMEPPSGMKSEHIKSQSQGALDKDPTAEILEQENLLYKDVHDECITPNSESMAKASTESEISEKDGFTCGSRHSSSSESRDGVDHGFNDHRVVVRSACDGLEGKDAVENLSEQPLQKPLGAWLRFGSLHADEAIYGDPDAYDDKSICPDGFFGSIKAKDDLLTKNPLGHKSYQSSHKPGLHRASVATVVSQSCGKTSVIANAGTPTVKTPFGGSDALPKCDTGPTGALSRRTRHLKSKGPV